MTVSPGCAAASLAAISQKLGDTLEPSLSDIFLHGTKLLSQDNRSESVSGLRLGLVGSTTTDLLSRAIAVACVQEGRFPLIHQAPFGAYAQELLDTHSAFYAFRPQIAVLVMAWRDCTIPGLPADTPQQEVTRLLQAKVESFERYWSLIEDRTDARIIQHLPAPPPYRLTGIAERQLPASLVNQIATFNSLLLAHGAGRVCFIDMERLAAERGTRDTLAPGAWHAAKLPFSMDALSHYVPAFRSALRTVLNEAKKILVLDLDNTVWGGVVGDDGVEGLALGPGDPRGEAFAEFQTYLTMLSARGVVLAACSKNDPDIAALGFSHPASVLRRQDFAAFECSWNDKAAGLRRIAQTLNIGLSSMVFADDNRAECDLVRRELDDVAVVALGEDPADFIRILEAGFWFDFQSLTAEDLRRSSAYSARARATSESLGISDIAGYLSNLQMQGAMFIPGAHAIRRAAQLESKTNQFNLTTRRYTEASLLRMMDADDTFVYAFSLADRFGDHGLVSVIILVREDDCLRIDDWLMSCRVFSRTAEHAIMREVIAFGRHLGVQAIVGEYRQTEKNKVVAALYRTLGFEDQGHGLWKRACSQSTEDLVTHVRLNALVDPSAGPQEAPTPVIEATDMQLVCNG
jgi:FkbH-like protein